MTTLKQFVDGTQSPLGKKVIELNSRKYVGKIEEVLSGTAFPVGRRTICLGNKFYLQEAAWDNYEIEK